MSIEQRINQNKYQVSLSLSISPRAVLISLAMISVIQSKGG